MSSRFLAFQQQLHRFGDRPGQPTTTNDCDLVQRTTAVWPVEHDRDVAGRCTGQNTAECA